MSLLPDPPTGLSTAMRGIDTGPLQNSSVPGRGLAEAALVNSSAFEHYFFDFNEVTLDAHSGVGAAGLFQYEESDGANTDFVKITPTVARPSHIVCDISADDSRISLVTVAQFLSEQNPWVEVAFDLESVTELMLAIGFSDPGAATAGDVIGNIDTPAVAAEIDDCAFAVIDTDATLQTLTLLTRDNSATTKVDASPTGAPFGIPTLATQVVYRVELRGQTAYLFVNGLLVATSAAAAGPRTGQLLECLIMFGNNHTTDKEVHIDYIDVGQERVSNLLV